MGNRISFHTFGCRLNQAETATIRDQFIADGFEETKDETSDIVVINTCTVTKNGDAETRKLVNRVAKKNPHSKVALIGCQAQLQAASLATLPNVRWIIGNSKKMELPSIIRNQTSPSSPVQMTDKISEKPFTVSFNGNSQPQTRANLKVQDGCDFFCFFCVIPYARGRARSRDYHDLIREASGLVMAGHKEIVLTGVNIGTYKFGTRNFSDVVMGLLGVKGIQRLRISSIEPSTVADEVIALMSSEKAMCRYLHLPIQSGSDAILFKMNRHYSVKEYVEFAEFALERVPGLCLGTDVIVGFPGESTSYFDETYEVLNNVDFAYFHVFSYSERDQAKSKKLPGQVRSEIIQKRSKILRRLSDTKLNRFLEKFEDSTSFVLFEQKKGDFWLGMTDNFIRVKVCTTLDLKNQILPVKLTHIEGKSMLGRLL